MDKKEYILENDKVHDILLMISQNDQKQPDNNQCVFNKINALISSDDSSQGSYAS